LLSSSEKYDFDKEFHGKGDKLLDTIFGELPGLRPLVSLKSPVECHTREVVFSVSYETTEDFSAILNILCNWLKQEDSQTELESLMLF
jgi:hypothetical protein